MKLFLVFISIFYFSMTHAKVMDCLVGESILTKEDFKLNDLKGNDDFFSKVAIEAIDTLIKSKPFDQSGVMFSINVTDSTSPKLKGYFIVKERAEQVNIEKSKCSPLKGTDHGFTFTCKVKNPNDNQNLILKFLYKFKLKMGVLDIKVNQTSLSYLTKNKFSCL